MCSKRISPRPVSRTTHLPPPPPPKPRCPGWTVVLVTLDDAIPLGIQLPGPTQQAGLDVLKSHMPQHVSDYLQVAALVKLGGGVALDASFLMTHPMAMDEMFEVGGWGRVEGGVRGVD